MTYIDPFYATREWRQIRYKVLLQYGGKCQCCGSLGPLNVDHIKPRKLYPKLALSFKNLQVLCADCNTGKGNIDQTDWRGPRKTWPDWLNSCPDPKIKKLIERQMKKRAKLAADEFVWNGGKLRK
jgi:5-methylcytosine-specific restriction endonuclease McrA